MPTKCVSLVKGRRIRLTRLDGCGRPVYGVGSQAVSKGFISVAFTANTTDSDEISVTNAAGEVCVFDPSITSLTGYGVEISFCEVDPDLFALVTGQRTVTDVAGNVVGFAVNTGVSQTDSGFALELWAGTANTDACATVGASGSYGYLLFPFIRGGIVGDFTIENGAVTFTLSGGNTRDGNNWGRGPYPVIPASVGTNEVQTVTISGVPTGGNFALSFSGQTTANLLYNSTAAAVQTALEALSNIDGGDVTVTGGPGPATPYVVTFTGKLAGANVPQLTATHTFAGGTTPNIAVTTTTGGVVPPSGLLISPLDPKDHLLMITTSVAPPAAVCGTRPLLDPASPAITSVVPAGTTSTRTFTVTPTATTPVWYDFGDGTWDYVAAPGSTSHTYARSGTYTVTASTNGVWVTASVTIS